MVNLKGKVSIITGAGRGIGKAISLSLAKHGSNVILAARTESQIEKVAEEAKSFGIDAIPVKVDVSKEYEVKSMVKKVVDRFGKIDILVNNAGVGYALPITETGEKDWDLMMNINAKGTFLCSREVLKEMIKRKIHGTIINIASAAGKKGYVNQSAYCASKFAVVGFSKVLSMEGKKFNIKVHVICPGGVNTEFIKNIRPDIEPSTLIQVEDIANTVLFLLSTREQIVIDEISIRRYTSQVP